MIDLTEQHILESESHLRHIDELMVRALGVSLKGTEGDETAALLRKIKLDRDRFAQELDEIRRLPPGEGSDAVKRGEGLKGVLARGQTLRLPAIAKQQCLELIKP